MAVETVVNRSAGEWVSRYASVLNNLVRRDREVTTSFAQYNVDDIRSLTERVKDASMGADIVFLEMSSVTESDLSQLRQATLLNGPQIVVVSGDVDQGIGQNLLDVGVLGLVDVGGIETTEDLKKLHPQVSTFLDRLKDIHAQAA